MIPCGEDESRWPERCQCGVERGLKGLESLQGYKVEPETTEPAFEKVPSRRLLIIARLGEWNDFLLSPRYNVSTLQRF